MERHLIRFAVAFAYGMVAVVLAVVALGFAAAAAYQGFARVLDPVWAALATAGVAVALAGVFALAASLRLHRRPPPRIPPDPEERHAGSEGRLAAEMGEALGEEIVHWTRTHPHRAAGAALLAGIAVGASPGLRRRLTRFLR